MRAHGWVGGCAFVRVSLTFVYQSTSQGPVKVVDITDSFLDHHNLK